MLLNIQSLGKDSFIIGHVYVLWTLTIHLTSSDLFIELDILMFVVLPCRAAILLVDDETALL